MSCEQYITLSEIGKMWNVSRSTLWRLRKDPSFPAAAPFKAAIKRYCKADILEYMSSKGARANGRG